LVIKEANEFTSAASTPTITQPPAVPVRKYRRVTVSPSTLLDETKVGITRHPPAVEDTRMVDAEDYVVSDDALSASSSVLSVDSSGGSKYDNVRVQRRQEQQDQHLDPSSATEQQSKDEDGDDEAEASESSSVSENQVPVDSTSGCDSDHADNFRVLARPDLLPSSPGSSTICSNFNNNNSSSIHNPIPHRIHALTGLQRRNTRNRDSGPYENVPHFNGADTSDRREQQQQQANDEDVVSLVTVYKHPRPRSIRGDFWDEEEEQHRLEHGDNDGLKLAAAAEELLLDDRYGSSLRSLLAAGQHKTTNV
jgi:hypothetical protein